MQSVLAEGSDVRAISWIGAFIQIAPLAVLTALLFLALVYGPEWPFYLVVAGVLIASFVSTRLAILRGAARGGCARLRHRHPRRVRHLLAVLRLAARRGRVRLTRRLADPEVRDAEV